MIILSLVNTKGGAGKTTMALTTAITCADAGHNVAVFDLDPNADLTEWVIRRGEMNREAPFDMFAFDNTQVDVAQEIYDALYGENASPYDVVVIDTPGFMTQELNYAILNSDLVIFPLQADPNEYRHAENIAKAVDVMAAENDTVIDYAFAFTAVSDVAVSLTLRKASKKLQAAGLPILPEVLKSRATFKMIKEDGATLRELAEGLEVEDGRILDPKRKRTAKEKSRARSMRDTATRAVIASNEFTSSLLDYVVNIKASHADLSPNEDDAPEARAKTA